MKKITETSKSEKTLSPLRMGLNLRNNYPFVLIHPEKKGYAFKVFWGEGYNLEIVGSSSKTHKTKKACITEIKKLKDFWGSVFGELKPCYDHKGNPVDIKIKSEVKRFF